MVRQSIAPAQRPKSWPSAMAADERIHPNGDKILLTVDRLTLPLAPSQPVETKTADLISALSTNARPKRSSPTAALRCRWPYAQWARLASNNWILLLFSLLKMRHQPGACLISLLSHWPTRTRTKMETTSTTWLPLGQTRARVIELRLR